MPCFSIVIPCCNYAATLPRAVGSVLEQDGNDLEVIIVDDGSTDDSLQIARSWAARHPQRVRVLSRDNAGPGAARNHGARVARGEWLLFLDADDVLVPGALARYRDAIHRCPSARIVVSGNLLYRDGTAAGAREAAAPSPDPVANFTAFLRRELCECNGAAILLHRSILERLSYPENVRTGEDVVLFGQALSLFPCTAAPGHAVEIHRHGASLRNDAGALETARGVLMDLLFDPSVLPEAAMRLRRETESDWHLTVSRALYRHGEYRQAASEYRRAVGLYPLHLLRGTSLRRYLASLLRGALSPRTAGVRRNREGSPR